MHNILDMLVIEQLQLDQHVRPDGSKPLPGICSASQHQPVLIVACRHPVEGLLQGLVRVVLIVQLLHLETVGQILKLDIGIFLDGQLGIMYGLFIIMRGGSSSSAIIPLSDMSPGHSVWVWFSSAFGSQTSPSADDILKTHKRLHLHFF